MAQFEFNFIVFFSGFSYIFAALQSDNCEIGSISLESEINLNNGIWLGNNSNRNCFYFVFDDKAKIGNQLRGLLKLSIRLVDNENNPSQLSPYVERSAKETDDDYISDKTFEV